MGVRISNLTETTTMADANTLPTDTTSGTRRISWANLKTAIFGAINGLTSKSTPVGDDVIAIGDSAASFAGKKVALNKLARAITQYAKISETQTSGTNGGTATADGTFKTRVLNTEDNDSGAIVSISSNQFTLQAGTYQIHATAPAFAVNGHKAKLRNITDGSDTIIGSTETTSSVTQVVVTRSSVVGEFTIAGAKAFELQHRFETTKTTNGLGVASSLGTEVYSVVEIWKVA